MGQSRHAIAVAALELTGSEHVLEIGCGHGVAVRLVLERLTTGTITALDRSPRMIELIRASVRDPRLVTCAHALEDAEFGPKRFDAIFAVNLDLDLRLQDRWPAMLKALLRPHGQVVLLLDPPPGSGKGQAFANQSLRQLTAAGFAALRLPAPGEMALVRGTLDENGASQPVS
jgi:protein-L-isoaspartate O-methyltransferase